MSDRMSNDDDGAVAEFKALMADPAARQAFVEVKMRAAESGAAIRYAHILRAVTETPWAIRPGMLNVIVDLLTFRISGGRLDADEIAARIGSGRASPVASPAGVAVIPLHGVIIPKAGGMKEMSGGTSIETFRENFRTAMAARDVSGIVVDVDSPGGMVDGVPEMAQEIRAARGTKPIVAVANTEANSAAYWLASQAEKLYVSRSGRVGSIGVLAAHEDESIKNAADGITTTLISAGKYKTEGNPYEPLTDEARGNMQGMVDEFYNMFVADVARGRGVTADAVRAGYGEGRVIAAAQAVDLGMADGIGTTEEVVGSMLQDAQAKVAASAAAYKHFLATTDTTTNTGSITGDYYDTSAAWSPLPPMPAAAYAPGAVALELLAANAPSTPQAMQQHLIAATPGGHGMSDDQMSGMDMAQMQDRHQQMHADGAEHSHGDMAQGAVHMNETNPSSALAPDVLDLEAQIASMLSSK